MIKQYEKPVIIKLKSGLMNKFGSNPYYSRKVRKNIDGVSIDELTEKFGSPLFVYSEKNIREKYKETTEAFKTRYSNVVFGWSYKTNYLSSICTIFHDMGSLAEVVSKMEYEKARKLGIPGNKIIFNGPHKCKTILERAIDEGAMIHIDHLDELYNIEEIVEDLGRTVKLGIRLNIDTGIHPQWSRFGFNLESGQAMEVVKRIKSNKNLILNGLHCHMGTFILESSAYSIQIEKMVKFGYEIEALTGFKIEYYDIGGGFPSVSHLKGTYLPPDISVPPIDEFAEAITTTLYRNLRSGDTPELIIESGRHMIDDAGYLISSVTASKRLPDGRKAYIIDAGLNLLFTSTWYKFNIEADRELQGINEPSVIYGPLCMNIDVIDEGSLLPLLQKGTKLTFSPVGAYNVTQWMQFIEYRPAIVLIGLKGEVDVIRETEDLSDIERRESIPERFVKN